MQGALYEVNRMPINPPMVNLAGPDLVLSYRDILVQFAATL